ncbi:MAG TPA: hypothetical protein VLM85_15640 [Polyangiaceae bacterium]|nr:hypothetical protein [Polyangiaceae bacterium]
MSARAAVLACGLGLAATGCAGARTTVVASHAVYPVSLSRAVRDVDGSLLPADRRKVVGTFHASHTAWNILWATTKLTPTIDISEEVNAQIAAAHGDAIVQLTIVTTHCALDYLFFPFGILPMFPSCADIDVHGDIVRVEPASSAPSAPAAPLGRTVAERER